MEMIERRCVLDPDVAAARIEQRLVAGNDPSDATPDIACRLAVAVAPWPERVTSTRPHHPGDVVRLARSLVVD